MRNVATVLLVTVVSALWLGALGCQSDGDQDAAKSQKASVGKSIDESVAVPPPKIEEPATPSEPAPAPKESEPEATPAASEPPKTSTEPAVQPKEKPVQGNPVVEVKTSMGTITIELYPDKAPITVANFLRYVDEKFYDGTIFHRVIGNFMIQGGGFEKGLKQKETREQIKNEATNGLKNDRGTIAMARTSVVDSATAQFFINVVDNAMLNHKNTSAGGFGYCVFGKVTAGMDVVDKIRAVATRNVGPFGDVPAKDVVIESVRRVEAKQ